MVKTERHRLVMVTVPNITVGRRLAKLVLEGQLAACVNIVPGVESHYWWQGKVCRDKELLLVMKTTQTRLKRLEKMVVEKHPYVTPEFIVLPITAGSKKYLDWVRTS
ncbi:MAG: divalent-cation tolerance protein CutA [Verrucomicrobiales bacterium]|nr:divalent-cation tolerance protein CutA [Verrucomicrobiales bacterium]